MDKISVIVPCYNVEKYITECIESLLSQEICGFDLEIVCVNDASKDGTFGILREYEKQQEDLILLINLEENVGLGQARNIGLDYCTGDYIFFLDSDDLLEKNALQVLYSALIEGGYDFACGGFYLFGEEYSRKDLLNEEYTYHEASDNRIKFIADYICSNTACAKLFSKDFLFKNSIMFPEGLYMEDIYFWSMCVIYASSCIFLKDIVYGYRQNPTSIMNMKSKNIKAFDGYKVEEILCDELMKRGMWNQYKDILAPVYFMKAFIRPFEGMGEITEEKIDMLRTVKKSLLTRFPNFPDNPYVVSNKDAKFVSYIELFDSL